MPAPSTQKRDLEPLPDIKRRHNSIWRWLAAPLVGISIILHVALLFAPLPAQEPTAEEEPETAEKTPEEEEEAVDILSLSEIQPPDPPEPVEEPPQPEQPPQQQTPPPPQSVPPPPDPSQAPQTPPPEEQQPPEEDPPPPENSSAPSFDPARQNQLLGQVSGGINAEFDKTDQFLLFAWGSGNGRNYVGDWSPEKRQCFFSNINQNEYTTAPNVNQIRFLTRNLGIVIRNDLPATFSAPDQELIEDSNGWCNGRFFEVRESGTPILWISALGVGPGDPPASALLVFWTSDPRQSGG